MRSRTTTIAATFVILASAHSATAERSNDCGWAGATYEQIRECQARVKAREAAENRAAIAAEQRAMEQAQAAWRAEQRALIRDNLATTETDYFRDMRRLGVAEADIAKSWRHIRGQMLSMYAEP